MIGSAMFDWQGHRGARGLRPENTLPGFELAIDLGVDTLELDLHLTADDVVVVWHDPEIGPQKCGDGVESVPVRRLTAAELAAIRCDRNPDPDRFPDQVPAAGVVAGDNYSIPTLAEVFDLVSRYAESSEKTTAQRATAETIMFNIETKRLPDQPETIGDGFDGENPARFEEALIAAADAAGVTDRITVQSFDHRSLFAVHSTRPEIRLAALTRRGEVPDFAALVDRGVDVWSPDHTTLTPELVGQAGAAGLAVIPWTVNDPAVMAQLMADGVDGIITDRPDLRPQG